MDPVGAEHRLAAIMLTDIVGYTALMAESEDAGLRARERHRALVRPLVREYHGESIEARGDESLSTFPSAVDAVNCALAIEARLEREQGFRLHIGIHSGDVVILRGEISGDGVNIASRICALSEGGGVCASGEVYQSVRNQPNIEATPLGERDLKNVGRPVAVYALRGEPRPPGPRPRVVRTSRESAGRRVGAVVAVVAALVAAGWWGLARQTPAPGPIRSLAVLPLDHLSGDPGEEYFTDAMTEALIAELAKIGALKVISRTSVMQYKGVSKPIPEIARELGVEAIVEGSVLRVDGQVRITAQLIRADTDEHLWAESYERDLRNVLDLQREVARSIARQVRVELTPSEEAGFETARPVDPDAHEAYLKGRHLLRIANEESRKKAVAYFEEAIAIDPEYAPAYAGLADAVT